MDLLRKDRLSAGVGEMMRRYRLIAPLERDGELRFDIVESPDKVTLDYYNTVKAPKSAFFPQAECMMRFGRQLGHFNQVEEVPLDETPTVLLGVRPCDARSFLLLDAIFARGPFLDPYYRARRQNTVVVSLACTKPRQTCFCHAFGSGPEDPEGSDLLLRDAGDAYLVQAVSERGKALLDELGPGLGLEKADDAHIAMAEATRQAAQSRLVAIEPVTGIEAILAGLFDSGVWAEISEKCLACGTCTYTCPTCHCFRIEDMVRAHDGERLRAWDSCMYEIFTKHASGHNPRPDQAARWRQRTMHKFEYLPRNVGRYGCVGCGRCILACPVRMDIRQVLDRVRREAAQQVEVEA
ncbi:MAG: 4Fe-4S dicluster domain-containing protein [Chloroflexi bacterium]|nr:4Fe-4S dicluster domain-containing protein [Chloroflexota bacterium]